MYQNYIFYKESLNNRNSRWGVVTEIVYYWCYRAVKRIWINLDLWTWNCELKIERIYRYDYKIDSKENARNATDVVTSIAKNLNETEIRQYSKFKCLLYRCGSARNTHVQNFNLFFDESTVFFLQKDLIEDIFLQCDNGFGNTNRFFIIFSKII